MCPAINMVESYAVHSEDNNTPPEKRKKRRFKTPSQVESLERFYSGMYALAISHLVEYKLQPNN